VWQQLPKYLKPVGMMWSKRKKKSIQKSKLISAHRIDHKITTANHLSLILLRLRCSVAECFDRAVFGR
jgi:hypothetical protein